MSARRRLSWPLRRQPARPREPISRALHGAVGRVFSSGSIRFAVGLDSLNGRGDPRLQRFMRNALADLTR